MVIRIKVRTNFTAPLGRNPSLRTKLSSFWIPLGLMRTACRREKHNQNKKVQGKRNTVIWIRLRTNFTDPLGRNPSVRTKLSSIRTDPNCPPYSKTQSKHKRAGKIHMVIRTRLRTNFTAPLGRNPSFRTKLSSFWVPFGLVRTARHTEKHNQNTNVHEKQT